MVKHTQTICRKFADKLFECVWPFCETDALRVKTQELVRSSFNKRCFWLKITKFTSLTQNNDLVIFFTLAKQLTELIGFSNCDVGLVASKVHLHNKKATPRQYTSPRISAILYKHTTWIPRGNHFNVKSTWCVCRVIGEVGEVQWLFWTKQSCLQFVKLSLYMTMKYMPT